MFDNLELIAKLLQKPFELTSSEIIQLIVLGLLVLLPVIWIGLSKLLNFFRNKNLIRDLHPFYTKPEVLKATEFYIPTKYQDEPPSNDLGFEDKEPTSKKKLISYFIKNAFKLNEEDYRFYMILGDTGMGKTTFLINLFLSYKSKLFKKYDIVLLPLAYKDAIVEIQKIKDPSNTILLLDAFDEDEKAIDDFEKRIDALIDCIQHFRKVVITCRTHFFPSQSKEPELTNILLFGGDKGYHPFRKIYLSPFSSKDVNKYLTKKYGFFTNRKKKKKAKRAIENSPNLLIRPLLLSYIDDLISTEFIYTFSFSIYQNLISKWLERESNRYRDKQKEAFKLLLSKFSNFIAEKIYALENYQWKHSRDELEIDRFYIDQKEIADFEAINSTFKEKLELKSRSLLNRNVHGQYKFSHKSIWEFLVAEMIFTKKIPLDRRLFIEKQIDFFYTEMILHKIKNNIPPDIYAIIKNKKSIISLWESLGEETDLNFSNKLEKVFVHRSCLEGYTVNNKFVKGNFEDAKIELLDSYPVFNSTDRDDFLGVINKEEIRKYLGKEESITKFILDTPIVPYSASITYVLNKINSYHYVEEAFIVDEFGGLKGMTSFKIILQYFFDELDLLISLSNKKV